MSLYLLKPKTESKDITRLYNNNRAKCKSSLQAQKKINQNQILYVSFRGNL